MAPPRATVVTACHNYGHWVLGALKSALVDPYPDKRLVVVDDGSTDDTARTIFSWLRKPTEWISPGGVPGIRGQAPGHAVEVTLILASPNRGPSAARNTGIRALWEETDVFLNLDADDLYRPGKIARSVLAWQKAPGAIGVVYTDYDNWSVEGGHQVRLYRESYSHPRLQQECIVNPNSLVSRQALEKVGLFDEQMRTAEDWDLWLRIASRFMLVHLPESLVVMRAGSYNSTHTVPAEVWQANWARIRQKHGRP